MNDDLSYEEELLLQVAGRSRPSAKSQGKKRSRRAVSISDDDDEDFEAQQDDHDDEEEEEGEAPRRQGKRPAGVPLKKRRSGAEEAEASALLLP
jgi:hypothetical protein